MCVCVCVCMCVCREREGRRYTRVRLGAVQCARVQECCVCTGIASQGYIEGAVSDSLCAVCAVSELIVCAVCALIVRCVSELIVRVVCVRCVCAQYILQYSTHIYV